MKVAIVGSRSIRDINFEKFLSYIPPSCSKIISGGAQGVDFLAEIAASYLEIDIEIITPDYNIFGRRAPLIRNNSIVVRSDYVLAFWDMHSKGTFHTLKICESTNTPYLIIDIKDIGNEL